MQLSPLLVAASGATYFVDLERGTYRPILPYPGALAATSKHLFLARTLNEQTRLDKHDRDGLVWARRVPGCFDTHAVAILDDGSLAVCSTGSNEIVFLNAEGREQRRWSPDPSAEFDSWHINSLTVAAGRLYCTCFGRFERFRGYAGRFLNLGMILDVETRRPVVEGLSAPHDPIRLDNGWMVNDSDRQRVVFAPDGGKLQVLFEGSGFTRGLALLPKHYAIGFSSIRTKLRSDGTSAVALVERGTNRLVKTITLPADEIGGLCVAPGREVIDAMQIEQESVREFFGLLPIRRVIGPEDRCGSLEIIGPPRRIENEPGVFEVSLRISNRGREVWSSCNRPNVVISYQVLDRQGNTVGEGERTPIPMPVYPGRVMSINIRLKPEPLVTQAAVYLRMTLVQETVAWWQESPTWKLATIPVPRW